MYIDEYIDCLKAQVPLYRRLSAEITKQENAIINKDYAKLNEVLMQKDALLQELDIIEQKAVQMRAVLTRKYSLMRFNLTELGGVYSEGRLAPLKDVMDELKQLMQNMLEHEKHNEEMLVGNMAEIEEGLRRLRVGKKASTTYKSLNATFGNSAFIDTKQ